MRLCPAGMAAGDMDFGPFFLNMYEASSYFGTPGLASLVSVGAASVARSLRHFAASSGLFCASASCTRRSMTVRQLTEIVNQYDARMAQLGDQHRLILEPCRRNAQPLPQHLDRHCPPQDRVFSDIDLAHSAASEELREPVSLRIARQGGFVPVRPARRHFRNQPLQFAPLLGGRTLLRR